MSGHATLGEVEDKLRGYSGWSFLPKPFSWQQLRSRLEAHLGPGRDVPFMDKQGSGQVRR